MSIKNVKRRSYRNRRRQSTVKTGVVILAVVLLAAALFVFAVILGNWLRDQATEDTLPVSGETTLSRPFDISSVPIVIAEHVKFGEAPEASESGTGVSASHNTATSSPDTATAFPDTAASSPDTASPDTAESGGTTAADSSGTGTSAPPFGTGVAYNAVSVTFRTEDGLTYSSPTTDRYPLVPSGDVRLSDGMALLIGRYVCGVFYVSYPNEPASSRALAREYDLTLLSELFAEGVDDVVLFGFGHSETELADAVAFVRELRSRVTGRVGIVLDYDFYVSPDAQSIIRGMNFDCGFLALDLFTVDLPELMSPEELVADRLSVCGDMVRSFSVRVLLGCGAAGTDVSPQIRAATAAGALNLQVCGE